VVVRGEHQDARPLDEVQKPRVGQLLELGVADGDPFVHQQHVGLDRGGRGEGEARLHAGRIGLHRHRQEGAEPGERGDLLQPLLDLARAEAGDPAAQADVVEAAGRRVDAQRQVQQRSDAALHLDLAIVRLIGAGERAQQGGLARAVVADQAQPVAGVQLEGDVAERGDVGDAGVRAQPAADGHGRQPFLQRLGVDPIDREAQAQVAAGDRHRRRLAERRRGRLQRAGGQGGLLQGRLHR